ncbi:hypothetical protein B0J12DRAFT_120097 [Macrophomina phaseolina]|uniref:Uncharacterized protein n=1 Tax=Macrophomina phaseolina TaxID=35725 RepID=A0ABQ8G7K9_9PEZI|nr:hypothetical protein B0J12DRAFT_120097 [Macrophomina phaseolina]
MSCRCEMRPNFICLSLPAKCCCGGKGACSISTSDARPLAQPILHTTLLPKATPLLLSLQCKCSLACAVRPSSASPPRPRSPLWSATPACRRLISLARRPRSSRFLHHPRQAASSRLPFHAGSSSCLLPPARPRLSFPPRLLCRHDSQGNRLCLDQHGPRRLRHDRHAQAHAAAATQAQVDADRLVRRRPVSNACSPMTPLPSQAWVSG